MGFRSLSCGLWILLTCLHRHLHRYHRDYLLLKIVAFSMAAKQLECKRTFWRWSFFRLLLWPPWTVCRRSVRTVTSQIFGLVVRTSSLAPISTGFKPVSSTLWQINGSGSKINPKKVNMKSNSVCLLTYAAVTVNTGSLATVVRARLSTDSMLWWSR